MNNQSKIDNGFYFLERYGKSPLVVFLSLETKKDSDFDCWLYFVDYIFSRDQGSRPYLNSCPINSSSKKLTKIQHQISDQDFEAKKLALVISKEFNEILKKDPLLLKQKKKTLNLLDAVRVFAEVFR